MELDFQPDELTVTGTGHTVRLLPKEYALFECLALHPNRSFTREELLDRVWPLAVSVIAGIGGGMKLVGLNYLMQKETPPEAMGRVAGILNTLQSLIATIAPLMGGAVIHLLSIPTAFRLTAVLLLSLGILALLFEKRIWGRAKAA